MMTNISYTDIILSKKSEDYWDTWNYSLFASSMQSNISCISIQFARWQHDCGRSLLWRIALFELHYVFVFYHCYHRIVTYLICRWFSLWCRIVRSTLFEATSVVGMAPIYYAYNCLLCILQVLHLFWFFTIIRMAHCYIVNGKVADSAGLFWTVVTFLLLDTLRLGRLPIWKTWKSG